MDETIAHPFLEVAAGQPHRLAVWHSTGACTYGQLAGRAAAVAGCLRDLGITPGCRVSLVAKRSPQLVVGIIACLMAGAVVSVVDASYPRRRIEKMVAASRPACVLAAGAACPSGEGTPVVSIDEIPAGDSAAANRVCAHAYMGYTSGTTGQPKLVNGTHSAVRHFVRWYSQRFDLGEDCRFAMLSGLSHDPLWRDVFLPLSAGGAVYIPDVSTWARSEKLAAWLQQHAVTDLNVTPTMARKFLTGQSGRLPALRRVVLGGEPTHWDDVRSFREHAPEATFIASYGATETPQIAALNALAADEITTRSGVVPIGDAAPGFELLLTGEDGAELEGPGFGEIVVRSPHVAHGYFDTESTSFRMLEGVRGYATGDMALRTQEGHLIFRGRADRCIKIRGVRIESGEIEAAIRELPDVADAVVAVTPPDLFGPPEVPAEGKLVAFAVAKGGASITGRQVRGHLARLLPAAAVPDDVAVLPEFPTGANGKADLAKMLGNYKRNLSAPPAARGRQPTG